MEVESRRLLPVLALVLAVLLRAALGYNFDLQSPTIVSSGVSGSSIAFGFALVQHEFPNGPKVALVSAPKADGELEREGGVFICPFQDGASCEFDERFQNRNDTNNIFDNLPGDNESYIGQLLGYSLRTFSDHVVVCAPHFILSFQLIGIYKVGDPNGRCVVFDRNLANPIHIYNQLNLQLGGVDTSVLVNEDRLVVGSVRSGTTGRLFATPIDPSDSSFISTPSTSSPRETLLGYHIETGYFTVDSIGPDTLEQIVASTPRGNNHLGVVVIFDVLTSEIRPTFPTLIGRETDGYFGYDFTVFTLPESNGYTSLAVGCPLCNKDRGSVYVYAHTGDPSDPFREFLIASPGSDPGRFGTTLANIGDTDRDGYPDVAIAAPYANDGRGVVYIFRGYRNGLINNPGTYQEIPAVWSTGAQAFGYGLSGGMDIDGNEYPDLTISDLSGIQVTTVRTSPTVNVSMRFEDQTERIDLGTDRVCTVGAGVSLVCFTVTPCFSFTTEFDEVERFDLVYSLEVDAQKERVVLLQGDGALSTSNSVTDTIQLSRSTETCAPTHTFVLRADFTEVVPIPVHLEIRDVDTANLVALETDPATDQRFGGPLHPTLRLFVSGDEPAQLSADFDIAFNVRCSGGLSTEDCEPAYQLGISENFVHSESEGTLILAKGNEFGFFIEVENTAQDDGLAPLLDIRAPAGVLFNRSGSLSENAITGCDEQGPSVQCQLQNPTPGGAVLRLEVYFRFNISAFDLTSLEGNQLPFSFIIIDGISNEVVANATRFITLEAVATYGFLAQVSDVQYQAERFGLFQDTFTIFLNETGPQISLTVLVNNNRTETDGTVIPQSTLRIYLPVEITLEEGAPPLPLLIPTDVVSVSGTTNCSHYRAIPDGLSPIQEPINFIPRFEGNPPPNVDSCMRMEEELGIRCGVILCTVRELEPRPNPPSQLTIFAQLFSPSVKTRENLTIFSMVTNDLGVPTILDDSTTESEVSFEIIPAVLEVQTDCIAWWIVVVSVGGGIAALALIIFILCCLGVFRRWYKTKKDEAAFANDLDQPDSEFTYRQRVIPPIPGITAGRDSPELVEYRRGVGEGVDGEGRGMTTAEIEKEREAEAERELELDMLQPLPSSTPQDAPEAEITFDPHKGVDEDYEGPFETEI